MMKESFPLSIRSEQHGRAATNGLIECFPDRTPQAPDALRFQAAGGCDRGYSGPKQGLTGINVSQPGDHRLVQKPVLDGAARFPEAVAQNLRTEPGVQRLWPQRSQRVGIQVKPPKTPDIFKNQPVAPQVKDHHRMPGNRGVPWLDMDPTRHAQMAHEDAGARR